MPRKPGACDDIALGDSEAVEVSGDFAGKFRAFVGENPTLGT
jgi:hypothetical protein